MDLMTPFGYQGKRVAVVGAATGMGRAVSELVQAAGAEVVAMDFAPIDQAGVTAVSLNLTDPASIAAAAQACGDRVDAIFSCAGVADGTPGIEKVNFLGHRHLINLLLASGQLGRGSAVGFISSAAGLGWRSNLEELTTLLATPDFDSGVAWFAEHGKADYFHTKQAVCAYVAASAMELLKQGVRINAICPGPTDTPLARANEATWLGFGADYRSEVGIEAATAAEQAYPLVFLCSEAASAISGITLVSDSGYFAAGMTGTYESAKAITGFLLGE